MAVDNSNGQILPAPTNLWSPKPNLLSIVCPVTLVTKVFPHLRQNVYNIVYSQAVTHPSTNTTRCCLTSVIKRELVLSIWYGRRHWLIIRSIALANMYVFICFKSKWLQLFVKLNFEQLWMGQGETQQPRVPVWVSSGIAPVSDWRLLAHLK